MFVTFCFVAAHFREASVLVICSRSSSVIASAEIGMDGSHTHTVVSRFGRAVRNRSTDVVSIVLRDRPITLYDEMSHEQFQRFLSYLHYNTKTYFDITYSARTRRMESYSTHSDCCIL